MDNAITVFKNTKNTDALDELIVSLKARETGSADALPSTVINLLLYFRKIEFLVMEQYAKEVRRMPSYYHDDIREFSIDWEREETRHGIVIEEYLRVHGHTLEPISAKDVGLRYRLTSLWLVVLSWMFWFISPMLHMLVGLVNEITAKAGYWAFMKHVTDPELRKIISLIQAEEIRHLVFYQSKCLELLDSKLKSKVVSKFLVTFWKPVGAGNADAKAFAKSLLVNHEVSEGFFNQMEQRFEVISKHLPFLPTLVIKDIRSLIN